MKMTVWKFILDQMNQKCINPQESLQTIQYKHIKYY